RLAVFPELCEACHRQRQLAVGGDLVDGQIAEASDGHSNLLARQTDPIDDHVAGAAEFDGLVTRATRGVGNRREVAQGYEQRPAVLGNERMADIQLLLQVFDFYAGPARRNDERHWGATR